MDDLLFTSLFAAFGMTSVFVVITVLTAVMLLMGAIIKNTRFRKSTQKSGGAHEPATTAPSPEHVAVIAAAIARYGGASADVITMTGDETRGCWGEGVVPAQPMDRIQVLRRTR